MEIHVTSLLSAMDGSLVYFMVLAFFLQLVDSGNESSRCKWANEDCSKNDECCSEQCVRIHEGTNSRCATGALHFPCYSYYHCDDGLTCGDMYQCCSPYWGVCSLPEDCCDKDKTCREEDGFIYKRCLFASGETVMKARKNFQVLTLCSVFLILYRTFL